MRESQAGAEPVPVAATDQFLHALCDRLHDTPMQRRLRALRPWPAGVVFIERPGMTLDDIRRHFRTMRELGFSCLKQCQLRPGTDWRAVYHAALDEGILPWWYDDAGSEEPTPELLRELGIPEAAEPAEVRAHPAWRRRQEALYRARIDRPDPPPPHRDTHETDGLPGTLKRDEYGVPAEAAGLFTEWLRRKYGTVAALAEAWNFGYPMARSRPWRTWEDVESEVTAFVSAERQDYRRMADVYRFRADAHLAKVARVRDEQLAHDPLVPFRAGGEMGLFLPFAARSTDMEGIAGLMAEGGSFYPSVHPAWHFEEAAFEFARPVYLQAALAADWFKGGWSATWESTGGPQQLSGGRAPFVPWARDVVAGFTIDENTIAQLMLSWVAAGFRGFGQWCWNARAFGWEAGEFALLDRNQQVCERTRVAGRIAAACRRLRDELWEARKEPQVGVFQDFEADSFYAALSVGGRDMYKGWPVRARIGAGRALMNANVPWEHVTARNLRAGLADRYRVILLPAQLAMDATLLEVLLAYAERGGRVVMDAPGGWYGYDGRLLPTAAGSVFEKLFGCTLADFQYSRGNHVRWTLDGWLLDGFVLEFGVTAGRVAAVFGNGKPAVVENRVGRGSACVLGFEASLGCWRPGVDWLEKLLVERVLGGLKPPYSCEGALAYHLAAPAADHYFLVNDGPARSVRLKAGPHRHLAWEDPVSGEELPRSRAVAIPANGARWVRALKDHPC